MADLRDHLSSARLRLEELIGELAAAEQAATSPAAKSVLAQMKTAAEKLDGNLWFAVQSAFSLEGEHTRKPNP